MPTPALPDEVLLEAVRLRNEHRTEEEAAVAAGISRGALNNRLRRAAERGFLLGDQPAMPGYQIKSVASKVDGAWVKQTKAPGEKFEMPSGLALKGVTALVDGEGRIIHQHLMGRPDKMAEQAAMQAVVEGFKEKLPRAKPIKAPKHGNADLLNQFTVTDLHFGMLSWGEETGADYDLKIAESLLLDWFSAAIGMAPNAQTAVLAQLGDLLHHDSHLSVTPTHAHVLDADSRLQKMIRVAIRVLRTVVDMLLVKHEHVHIIMADANHDPAGGAWLREMFAAFYDEEPRVTVDSSASTFYVYEHGETSLFYHHGHKRKIATVDSVFAGKFREAYGRTKHSYAHVGHLHCDELKSTNLMKVEQHETLAAPDAFAANGGWLAGRSAKVITYHREFGEVSRITLSPQMVQRAA